jgi:subtilisin family serine protease
MRRGKPALSTVLGAVGLAAAAIISAGASGATNEWSESFDGSKGGADLYIVRMVEPPAVAYDGGINGLKPTKPGKGKKIDPDAPDVIKYIGYLDSRHDAVLAKVGGQKIYDYRYAFNGFASKLSPGDVGKLESDPAVLSVEASEELTLDTATTPSFIGLTDPAAGLWTPPRNLKGEDVVIGVIDGGVWPEAQSFSDRDANGKLIYKPNPGIWHGRKCTPGEQWNASLCNQKLIGARFFCAGRLPAGCAGVPDRDFLSPRDTSGHGTHTASTAGGNENVATTGPFSVFGSISGIAPRARIAAYKVCFDGGDGQNNCFTSDSVAAIDQAVADGVDVLNFSISGTRTSYLDSVEVAFLAAADAGVFVATSAGNSGPTASTVAHISPWLASVAAGTHSRSGEATASFGAGGPSPIVGGSLSNGAAGPAQLVKSTSVGLPDKPADDVRRCFLNALDPALVAGKIVQCDRGFNLLVEKSAEVARAGGVGMILTNVTPGTVGAEMHSVPTVHVADTFRASILSYIDAAGAAATASLSAAVVTSTTPAPAVAGFSSRGPSLAGGGDLLKPDFMLPGQDILAAVSPYGDLGRDFDVFSGTSMSSPHVAGVAALLTQAHPDWSPAAMRSAMATTAHQSIVGGYSPFGAGSGQVRPNLATDPGLVYDADTNDYLAFLKGQGLCCASDASIPALDASDLNQPSLAVGDLAGAQTLHRTVTNVGGSAATYTSSVVLPGFSVSVSPSSFTIPAGGTQSFDMTITRTTATLNTYTFGALTWADGTHTVRSPIAVRPIAIRAPAALTLAGASGATSYQITTGYNGGLAYAVRGLIPSTVFSGTVPDDPADSFDPSGPGVVSHSIVVPTGTSLLRISMFDEDTDGADDLDLYLFLGGTLVAASQGTTSTEQIQLAVNPASPAITLTLYVHGFQTDGPDAAYSLHRWALGTTDAGKMAVSGPTTAVIGMTGTVSVTWGPLDPGMRYLGQIRYNDGLVNRGSTIVRIDS